MFTFWNVSLGQIPGSEMTGSEGVSIFSEAGCELEVSVSTTSSRKPALSPACLVQDEAFPGLPWLPARTCRAPWASLGCGVLRVGALVWVRLRASPATNTSGAAHPAERGFAGFLVPLMKVGGPWEGSHRSAPSCHLGGGELFQIQAPPSPVQHHSASSALIKTLHTKVHHYVP